MYVWDVMLALHPVRNGIHKVRPAPLQICTPTGKAQRVHFLIVYKRMKRAHSQILKQFTFQSHAFIVKTPPAYQFAQLEQAINEQKMASY